MKNIYSKNAPAIEQNDLDNLSEIEELKDVFHPEFGALPGETSMAFQLRYTFVCTGYNVTRIELIETPPVVIVRAVRIIAPRIRDYKLFLRMCEGC